MLLPKRDIRMVTPLGLDTSRMKQKDELLA
jgi:hypothetical protein